MPERLKRWGRAGGTGVWLIGVGLRLELQLELFSGVKYVELDVAAGGDAVGEELY